MPRSKRLRLGAVSVVRAVLSPLLALCYGRSRLRSRVDSSALSCRDTYFLLLSFTISSSIFLSLSFSLFSLYGVYLNPRIFIPFHSTHSKKRNHYFKIFSGFFYGDITKYCVYILRFFFQQSFFFPPTPFSKIISLSQNGILHLYWLDKSCLVRRISNFLLCFLFILPSFFFFFSFFPFSFSRFDSSNVLFSFFCRNIRTHTQRHSSRFFKNVISTLFKLRIIRCSLLFQTKYLRAISFRLLENRAES